MSKRLFGSLGLAALLAVFVVALGLMSLQGTQVVAQVKEEVCDNGIDDDGNKLTDCDDPACDSAPNCQPPGQEICDNGIDDDGDKLVDCADSDCTCEEGTPCSPGWWKNHEDAFNTYCGQVTGWTCGELWTAITCRGSQPGCTGPRRQAAASALNAVSGCTE